MKKASPKSGSSRRQFIGGAAAAVTLSARGGEALPLVDPIQAAAPTPALASAGPRAPLDLTTLRVAQTVSGLRQTDEALTKALPLVTRYRSHAEAFRGIPVATTVEPAFSFDPRRGRKVRTASKAAAPRSAARPRAPLSAVAAPSSPLEIAFASTEQLQSWLRAGRVSSEELMKLSLDRLIQHNPTLTCVVTLADLRGVDEAKKADAERRGPSASLSGLHGIPYGAKDIIDSAGIRTLWGARPYRDRPVPTTDATSLGRLASTGACLAAKLSTGELAIGDSWGGEPQFQDGRPLSGAREGIKTRKTKNPWDPTTGSSGSSAGPASAVAAGLVPFALGTETGGSVISPASTCGVVGLRPTYGRVPRHGVMTLRWTLDKVGVLARSVTDCGLALQAIHGPDGFDGTVTDTPFIWNANSSRPSQLKLGIIESELFQPPVDASEKDRARFALSRAVFEAAVEVYRKLGFLIVPIELPDFPSDGLYAIHNAEAGAMFDDITRNAEIDTLEGQGPSDRSTQLRASRFISAVDYLRAQRVRTLMLDATDAMFDKVDVFLAPPSSDSLNITNLTGHPAIALPAGFIKSDTGIEMPQSIMLTGRIDDEATLLDAALAFERETPWHARRPPLYSA
ncbi:MAG: amidase [Vicinamibacteria bacterium]